MNPPARVQLHWLPLGAGGPSVRANQRSARYIHHSALEVHLGRECFMVEMAPAWRGPAMDRGVVVEGPVGSRLLGRSPLFRYEVRRWRSGVIPGLAAEYADVQVSDRAEQALRLLALVPLVPALTWGRDEARTGERWNSNSMVSWLLASSGHDMRRIGPPAGARAPGWRAGLSLATHSALAQPLAVAS